MRARRIRRGLHVSSALLAAAVVVTGVLAAEARPDPGPPDPERVRRFVRELDANARAVLVAPVSAETLGRTLEPLPFVGPLRVVRRGEDTHDAPVPDLTSLGQVLLVVDGPDPFLGFAFADGRFGLFAPGEEIRARASEPARFRLDGIEPAVRGYRIAYTGLHDGRAHVLAWSGRAALGPEDPIRLDAPVVPPRPRVFAPPVPRGRAGLGDLRPEVTRLSPSRTEVRLPPRLQAVLRGPEAKRAWGTVKTGRSSWRRGVRGLRIVDPGGLPLGRIRVGAGDVLLSVNGVATPHRGALARALRTLPRDTVHVTAVIDRNGRRVTVVFDLREERLRNVNLPNRR